MDTLANSPYLMTGSIVVFPGVTLTIQPGVEIRVKKINNNVTGIALGLIGFGQPAPVVENNHICYNTGYNIDNRTDLNLFIPANCFCTTDPAIREEKILDGYDDITKGLISYAIFDTTCTAG